MRINFSKMHGLGNDFVVIDAINQKISLSKSQINLLADRHFGIGFDQLLLVEMPVSTNAEFRYRIFNADGSEVSQCGNGARCFAKFVLDKKLTNNAEIIVDTNAGQLTLSLQNDGCIKVNMGIPKHHPKDIPMQMTDEAKLYHVVVDDINISFAALSIGNPHVVMHVEDVANAAVEELGPKLEHHSLFPERANIGFMQIIDRGYIKLRVYERGAAETLACGSGACAAVVAGIDQNLLENEVRVSLPGGDLKVCWLGRGESVFMTGPATLVYEGQIEL